MRILVLSQYWHPESGVPQRRWTWLSEILINAGHDVTVIAPPPHYQRAMSIRSWWKEHAFFGKDSAETGPAGETIIRSGFFPAGSSLTQRVLNQATVALGALWTVLRRSAMPEDYRPDLVIGTVPALPTAAVTYLVARHFEAPYVIDLRDAWPDLLKEAAHWNKATGKRSFRERVFSKGPMQFVSAATEVVVNFALKNAAVISVTSTLLATSLEERPMLKNEGRRAPVSTLRNVFPPQTDFRKTTVRSPESPSLNVLYAGTFGRAQNLENALLAVEIARDMGVEVELKFVGAGVTREALTASARAKSINASFEARYPATDLAQFYEWADTALVHLTDWSPLDMAVPSKTYELMAVGVHISGVVSGETAEIIRRFRAGDVVAPEDPAGLARLWVELAHNRDRLRIGDEGARWVVEERNRVVPSRLLELIGKAAQG